MNRFWWQLPGPSQFISTIAEDLRAGKNVFVCLPKHMPRGLSGALRSAFDVHQELEWCSLRPRQERPLEFLNSYFDGFDPQSSSEVTRTVSSLAKSEKLAQKIIWLEGIEPSSWEQWSRFFTEYGQAAQHSQAHEGPVFCVPLTGALATTAIADTVWSQYLWRGVVSSIDMLLFTSSLLQERSFTPLQRQVARSVIAKLSLWDPELCQRLVLAELGDILKPKEILQELADKRKWRSPDTTGENSWHEGMIDFVDNKPMIHSAIFAFDSSQKEIDRRIWSAEIAVLLPLVEEGRRELIEQCRPNLQLPWRDRFGTVEDIYDLEINHIRTQIERNVAILDIYSQRLTDELTKIRNLLSHLRTVPLHLLDSEVLNHFVEQQLERQILSSPIINRTY